MVFEVTVKMCNEVLNNRVISVRDKIVSIDQYGFIKYRHIVDVSGALR
jgi:hypothetical protein